MTLDEIRRRKIAALQLATPMAPGAPGVGGAVPAGAADPRIAAIQRRKLLMPEAGLPAPMAPAEVMPPAAQPSLGQDLASNALLGFGLGAATESPIGAGIGAGLGLLGTYLNRRRKNPIRLAAGGAAKERKDFPRTRPPKKRPKGMGAATRGHKQF